MQGFQKMAKKKNPIWRQSELIGKIYLCTVCGQNIASPISYWSPGGKVRTVDGTDHPHIKAGIHLVLAPLVVGHPDIMFHLSKQHPHSCPQC